MLNEKRNSQVTEFCQKLIQTQSYSGDESAVAYVIADKMKNIGFDEIITDDYGNTYGHIKGKKEGKKILFDGHMDTVPVTKAILW